jgi:hypothetical protein
VNIANIQRGRPNPRPIRPFALGGPVLPAQAAPQATSALAARPALPAQAQGARPFAFGGGLPAQAAPQATTALAARPALPTQAQGARPFRRGGRYW